MTKMQISKLTSQMVRLFVVVALVAGSVALAAHGGDPHSTSKFQGPKANTGTAMHTKVDGKNVFTLSDDFQVPNTPAPHWQLVDSSGNTYLLNRLKIKDDKYNKSITAPAYIKDVVKVQVWCSWAEANLGEAPFEKLVK
jgi:hypothetical protein